MKKKFKDLLHRYKVEAFKVSHNSDQIPEIAQEIAQFTEETLKGAYHYQFHEDPDPERIATFNMIKNFTLEALLPPVLERITQRIVVLEKQHSELVRLVDEILEVLSDDEGSQEPGSNVG